jgi:ribonuclease HI
MRFDGLFKHIGERHVSGLMCYGWEIRNKSHILVAEGYGSVAHPFDATSVTAEYLGLIEGLKALIDLGLECERVNVIGDAKNVVCQMGGSAAVNSRRVKPLYKEANELANHFSNITWNWAPRNHNKAADYLTRRAMIATQANIGIYKRVVDFLRVMSKKKSHDCDFTRLIDNCVFH